jgi:hypothetical protein
MRTEYSPVSKRMKKKPLKKKRYSRGEDDSKLEYKIGHQIQSSQLH